MHCVTKRTSTVHRYRKQDRYIYPFPLPIHIGKSGDKSELK